MRVATPADAAELLVLQRACWVPEGRLSGSWTIPPLDESLEEVAAGIGAWTTYAVRTASADGAPGRLVASVRGRVRPDDPTVWETGRLMVAPDLQGRGLGRELLALAEAAAPASVTTFWINTGAVSEGNQRRYRRAGYRRVPGERHLPRHRRPRQAPPLSPNFPARCGNLHLRTTTEPVRT